MTTKKPLVAYDNTTVSAFRRCERYGYYRHIRHFVSSSTATPLIFGKAWHAGHDAGWAHLAGKPLADKNKILETVQIANAAFLVEWIEGGLPTGPELAERVDDFSPRTPDTAAKMYQHYYTQNALFLSQIDLLGIEQPFIVPIFENDNSIAYIGLLDKLFRHPNGFVIPLDHKTTSSYSKTSGLAYQFTQSFHPDAQIEGYQYATQMLYSPEEVTGAWIDASLVHRNKDPKTSRHDIHRFLPILQPQVQINDWLNDTRVMIERIEEGKEKLKKGVHCFPKNTNNCTYYSMCAYQDFCTSSIDWQAQETPMFGMKIERWNPVDILDKE